MGTKKERTKLLLAFIFFSFLFLLSVFFSLSFCANKAGKGGNNNQNNNIPPKNDITSPDSGKNATSIIKEVKVEVISSRLVILRWETGKLGAPNMRKMSFQEKEKMSLPILFEVSRTDEKGDDKILGQTNQNSFVDSPEKAGRYCWKVKAKKNKEENELCSFDLDLDVKEVCSEIKDGGDTEPPPPSPSNLKAERQGEKVILSWERKGRELGFKVQRCIKKENSDCSSDGFYVVGITEDTIFEDEILCVGSNEACWRVVAYNKGGESGYSNKVCLKLDCVYVLFWKDEDQDGYGSEELKICVKEGQMPAGVTIVKGDCDDLDPKRNPSSAEVCDGKDNDCDLDIDEGCECKIGQERSCYSGPSGTEGVGVCKAGIQRCEGGVWGKCEGQVLPTSEICDGLDNDCNGQTDEGFNVGQSCNVGVGECTRTGQYVCKADGSGTECNAVAGTPTAEVCDGKDNDCDGKIDEADEIIQVKYVCPVTFAPNYCNGIDDRFSSCDPNGYEINEGIVDNQYEWWCEASAEGRQIFISSIKAIESNSQPQITYLYRLSDNSGSLYQTSSTIFYFKITSDEELLRLGSQLSGKDLGVDFSNEFILAIGLYTTWCDVGEQPLRNIVIRGIKLQGDKVYFIIAPMIDGAAGNAIRAYTDWDFMILPKKYLSYQMVFVDVFGPTNVGCYGVDSNPPQVPVPDFCPFAH